MGEEEHCCGDPMIMVGQLFLARELKLYDQPRKILQAIPQIELVELERNREKTWCCGGGGGVKGVDFDLSVEIGKDKVKEALATGAGTIVSACPTCKTTINDAIKATGPLLSPVSGKIAEVNQEVLEKPTLVNEDPYGKGWMVVVEPSDLDDDLTRLLKGDQPEAVEWMKSDIREVAKE